MNAAQVAFKPGKRIALPYLPILKVENNVAVLKKTRPAIGDGCGRRHQVRVETPFYIRGGFRVEPITKYRVLGWTFTVRYETPWGAVGEEKVPDRSVYLDNMPTDLRALAEELARKKLGDRIKRIIDVEVNEQIVPVTVYTRKFRHAVVEIPEGDYFIYVHGPDYFVYEFINESESKLVDDVSRIDYVLLLFSNALESRAACATIKLLRGDVVWSNFRQTCCAIRSNAVGMAVVRYGGRVVVAHNQAPYRGCCESWVVEEWEATVPPKLVHKYETSEPVASSITPEEVV